MFDGYSANGESGNWRDSLSPSLIKPKGANMRLHDRRIREQIGTWQITELNAMRC